MQASAAASALLRRHAAPQVHRTGGGAGQRTLGYECETSLRYSRAIERAGSAATQVRAPAVRHPDPRKTACMAGASADGDEVQTTSHRGGEGRIHCRAGTQFAGLILTPAVCRSAGCEATGMIEAHAQRYERQPA